MLAWVVVVGAALAAACSWIVYSLLIQNGRLLLRLEAIENQLIDEGILPPKPDPTFEGLAIGTMLSDFCLPSLSGGAMTLSQWRGRRILLIFVNPQCSFSRELLAEVAALPKPAIDPMPLIVSTGDPDENRRMIEEYPVSCPVLLQEGSEVSGLYKLRGTPVGYLVDEKGAVASDVLVGAESLFARLQPANVAAAAGSRGKFSRPMAESRLNRDGLKAGTVAPDFTLPRLDGADLSLRDFRGRRVLLVFSDPGCHPCMRLAPQLEELHRDDRDVAVLMVSRGSVEDNRKKVADLGLTFPIVLQSHWEISRAYGIFATPVGYLIDERGILSSDVAVGGESILKLASPAAVLVGKSQR